MFISLCMKYCCSLSLTLLSWSFPLLPLRLCKWGKALISQSFSMVISLGHFPSPGAISMFFVGSSNSISGYLCDMQRERLYVNWYFLTGSFVRYSTSFSKSSLSISSATSSSSSGGTSSKFSSISSKVGNRTSNPSGSSSLHLSLKVFRSS